MTCTYSNRRPIIALREKKEKHVNRRTDCTPYLLNLGLTKSNTSLVWIAGPLSGLIVQPIVGVIADESTSRWGRRRPLMVIGTAIVAVCLLVLGFTREIVGLVVDDDDRARRPTIVLAVLAIYAVDFAINAGMLPPDTLVS
jgi:solute carrier family 45 protein 1/2/4